MAAEWRIEPRVSVSETYTDNIDQSATNEDSEFITSAGPGVSVRGEGARVQLGLDYDVTHLWHAKMSERDEFQHGLSGTGTIEAISQHLFIDAQASVSEQTVSNTGAVSTNPLTDTQNRTTVQTYNVTPRLLFRFGDFAESRSSWLNSFSTTDNGVVSDTTTSRLATELASGDKFTRLLWNLSGSAERTERSGDAPSHRTSNADARLDYVFGPKVRTFGTVGYERVRDGTLTNEPEGSTWSVGTVLTPGRKLTLDLSYGHRFDTNDVEGSLIYEITPRTTLRASYSESIQITQVNQADTLSFLTVDQNGVLVDSRTGQPFAAGDSAFGLTDSAFRQERFEASLIASRRRNTYTVTAFDETRHTEATNTREESYGTTVSFGRALSRRADANASATYRFNEFATGGREDDFYSFAASLSYRISDTVTSSLSYDYTQRDSSDDTADFTQNTVSLLVSKSF